MTSERNTISSNKEKKGFIVCKMEIDMSKKAFIFLLSLFFLVGCATTAKYKTKLNTWIGHSENELIASWGTPQNVYYLSNGKKQLNM